MAINTRDYEKRFGRMLRKNVVNPEYRAIEIATLFILNTLFISLGILIFVRFFKGDFSRDPILSDTRTMLLIMFTGVLVILFPLLQTYRLVYCRHGVCLYEKGFLWSGRYGRDDESNFTYLGDVERIVIAPSRNTAAKLMTGILTAGFGEPLTEGYNDWEYSKTMIENGVRSVRGNIVVVTRQRFFDYEFHLIPVKKISEFDSFRMQIMEIARNNNIQCIDESDIPVNQSVTKPIMFKNIRDCEPEFGKILYEGFTKNDEHLFERGILKWYSWPLNPQEYNFIYFKNLDRILVQPSKEAAEKSIEPIEKLYYQYAPLDEKEAYKIDALSLESQALKWENAVAFVYKLKRADWWFVPISDFKDIGKFLSLVRPLAEKYGVEVIDDSHLSGLTREEIKA